MKNYSKQFLLAVFFMNCLFSVYSSERADLQNQLKEVDDLIANIETKVEKVCVLVDQGKLNSNVKYVFAEDSSFIEPFNLSFSKKSFDEDLNTTFDVIEKYSNLKLKLNKRLKQLKPKKTGRKRVRSPEDLMRQAEEKTKSHDNSDIPHDFQSFNVFESYEGQHKLKQAERDKMAEADIMRVNEERRLAEAEIRAKEEYDQKIQQQNKKWQRELDNQAEKAAQEAARWKRERGFGNFVKGLFRTTLSAGLSSLTGGFAGSIGAGAADLLSKKMFPKFNPSGQYDKELSANK